MSMLSTDCVQDWQYQHIYTYTVPISHIADEVRMWVEAAVAVAVIALLALVKSSVRYQDAFSFSYIHQIHIM